ncbi:putative peptide chain release factor 1, mitochondrial [Staphylotrichum tortipilum]|uniref:Peptide chain release factor 1, mitochondrial n=1 Tax=Staphylotrichum tortipilum TaxID=2831512 RepID=A0AAN6MTY7_9PEZI|nr:putative peptide chain release factor 1, mitochondrial [Staphylotrichum longicolle]
MFASPWVCRSCARSLTRARVSQFIRRFSTEAPVKLPPALLERARKLTVEHDQLAAGLQSDFDVQKAKRAGEISRVAEALKQFEKAQSALGELHGLLESDDAEMRELAKEDLDATKAQLAESSHNLSVTLTPKHPFADMPCLLEIHPGPGGTEGRFFADSIFHMYKAYCDNKGYRTRVVQYVASDSDGRAGSEGEIALQEAVLEIQEPGAYGLFRGESGMHRVQRVPITENSGRTHTSAAAVWVLPSFPESSTGETEADWENPESDFYIDPTEVRTETMRARGAGGQHVNKTESAIRLTHIPTGITVSMQDSRSQQRNRADAWRVLRSRMAQKKREDREELSRQMRSSVLAKSQITRGDKIRTYQYQQDRCTDHRSGVDAHNLPDVLRGGETLGKIMDSVQSWLINRDIQMLIAEEEAASAAPKKKGK